MLLLNIEVGTIDNKFLSDSLTCKLKKKEFKKLSSKSILILRKNVKRDYME